MRMQSGVYPAPVSVAWFLRLAGRRFRRVLEVRFSSRRPTSGFSQSWYRIAPLP